MFARSPLEVKNIVSGFAFLLFSSSVLVGAVAAQQSESTLRSGDNLTVVLGGDVATIVRDQLLVLKMTNQGNRARHFVKTQASVLSADENSITLRALVVSRSRENAPRMVTVTAVVDRDRIEAMPSKKGRNTVSPETVVRLDRFGEVEIETWERVRSIDRLTDAPANQPVQ